MVSLRPLKKPVFPLNANPLKCWLCTAACDYISVMQEPVSPPEGESFASFAFQDLADVSGASVKELNTQIPGETKNLNYLHHCLL